MFTGIITARGRVVSLAPNDFGIRLIVDPQNPPTWPAFPQAGDSVAVNGCCLTYAPHQGDNSAHLGFDVIRESLDKTSLGQLADGRHVNLELSLTPTTAMGGHFVQGHIDGTGTIVGVTASDAEYVLTIEAPAALMATIVPKGSITIDGVSLTLASVTPACHRFSVALIPTTLDLTNLAERKTGDRVNLECDIIAKTVVHYLSLQTEAKKASPISGEMLKAAGFVE
ncbi:MAG: riboflavin synthase [Phycisphaeraceae bacterium]